MIDIRPAASRATTSQPGIVTRHCFSSGSRYDPGNVCFGPLIAVDEHTVEPGMGFASHRHRGVQILSWIVAGALSHRDEQVQTTVAPGSVLLQRAGQGIEHDERNAREDIALTFIQLVFLVGLDDDESTRGPNAEAGRAAISTGATPLAVSTGHFTVSSGPVEVPAAQFAHLYVAAGAFAVGGRQLRQGDSVRAADQAMLVTGDGDLLVWASS